MPTVPSPRPAPARRPKIERQINLNATPRCWAGANLASHETEQLEKSFERLRALPEAHRPFWSLARVAYLQVRAELTRRTPTAY